MQIIENVDGNSLLLVDGLQVDFFSYGYPLLEPVQMVENIGLASMLDIGLMKLDAVIGRGSRKDFFDLYFISRQIPLPELLSAGERKYPQVRDFPLMALEGILQFDNADRDLQPEMLVDLPWDNVRQFFVEQGKVLGGDWFEKLTDDLPLKTAHTITLALRSDSDDVHGLMFAQNAWHAVEFNAYALFFARGLGGGVSLSYAEGSSTSFGWLAEVWQR